MLADGEAPTEVLAEGAREEEAIGVAEARGDTEAAGLGTVLGSVLADGEAPTGALAEGAGDLLEEAAREGEGIGEAEEEVLAIAVGEEEEEGLAGAGGFSQLCPV